MTNLNTMYPGVANSPDTFLTSALASGGTVMYVADGSVFGAIPNLAVLGTEANAETVLLLSKRTDNGYNIQRAVEGIARDWPQATIAARNFTNRDYKTLIENVEILNVGKVEIVDGMGLSKNNYTDEDRDKVRAIPEEPKYTDTTYTAGANVSISAENVISATDTIYEHPSSHPASMITESTTKKFVSDEEKNNWNNKQNKLTAGENITITDGVISATGGGSNEPITIISQHDIVKENGFEGYARVYLLSNGWKFLYLMNLYRSSASPTGIRLGALPLEYRPQILQNQYYFVGLNRSASNVYTPVFVNVTSDGVTVYNPEAGSNGVVVTGFYY